MVVASGDWDQMVGKTGGDNRREKEKDLQKINHS